MRIGYILNESNLQIKEKNNKTQIQTHTSKCVQTRAMEIGEKKVKYKKSKKSKHKIKIKTRRKKKQEGNARKKNEKAQNNE